MFLFSRYRLDFKYIALSDINIILSFGPLPVIYVYIAQTGHYSIYPILSALPLTLIAEAILHSNNTRDLEHDRSAGIYTLPILIGKRHSYYLYCLLMYIPYLIAIYLMIHVMDLFLTITDISYCVSLMH